MNYDILYVADGEIFKVGPFLSEVEAIEYIRNNNGESGEFDINNQHIYIIDSQLGLNEIYLEDLGEVDD
jgi:hypothetical protein